MYPYGGYPSAAGDPPTCVGSGCVGGAGSVATYPDGSIDNGPGGG